MKGGHRNCCVLGFRACHQYVSCGFLFQEFCAEELRGEGINTSSIWEGVPFGLLIAKYVQGFSFLQVADFKMVHYSSTIVCTCPVTLLIDLVFPTEVYNFPKDLLFSCLLLFCFCIPTNISPPSSLPSPLSPHHIQSPSSVYLQKREGLPRMSVSHGLSSCSEARHILSQ